MKRCLTAIVLGLAATSALAVDDKTGWNAGLAAAFAEYSFDSGQLDNSSAGFKVFGGYRFNKWVGLEGAFYDFGDFDDDLDPPNPGGDVTAQIDGLTGSALIYAPLDTTEFDAYAKVGYYSFDQQVLLDDSGGPGNSPSGLLLGAGSRFYISDQFAIRAEGEWFDIKDGDLWTLNLGFEYLFGRPAKAAVPVAAAVAAPVVAAVPALPADSDGDGVVDGTDQCPETPTGERVGPFGCTCDITRQVQFSVESAELTDEDKVILDEVAESLNRLKFVSGTVVGHTDSTGTEAFNQGLSVRRAQSVSDYLQSKGIAVGRLAASGAGQSEPIADNDTEEGRAQNRRVVLKRTDCDKPN
jgi:outer membrane protein OmpA-like peptidoglycan-associated protein